MKNKPFPTLTEENKKSIEKAEDKLLKQRASVKRHMERLRGWRR